ncbi:MAG: hypothetical protein J6Y07_00550 [Alphaproteobacteria bacterium]|nr:hypothetical protein [Alphaproteobacteria bacterium]
MKKYQNLKIHQNYKILALALLYLFILAGCKKHANIILDKDKNEEVKEVTFIIKDVETGVERFYKTDKPKVYKDFDYLYPGDTIYLTLGSAYDQGHYVKRQIVERNGGYAYSVGMNYDKDRIELRKEYEYSKFVKNKEMSK